MKYEAPSITRRDGRPAMLTIFNNIDGVCETEALDATVRALEPLVTGDFTVIYNIWSRPLPQVPGDKILILTSYEEGLPVPRHFVDDPSIKHIFKHYFSDAGEDGKVHPLPLPYVQGVTFVEPAAQTPVLRRPVDYFFSGCRSAPRVALEATLAEHQRSAASKGVVRWYDGWNNGLPKADYSRHMADAKIAICPYGQINTETFRFTEAAANGCVIVTSSKPARSFYPAHSFVALDDWSRIGSVLDELLSAPARLTALQRAAQDLWTRHLSPPAVAAAMAAVLSGAG
jgi:hypothetical protein